MDKHEIDPEAIAREWARRHPEFMKPIKEKKVVKMDERTAQAIRDELNAARLYICPQCKKEFTYKAVFKRHQESCRALIKEAVSKQKAYNPKALTDIAMRKADLPPAPRRPLPVDYAQGPANTQLLTDAVNKQSPFMASMNDPVGSPIPTPTLEEARQVARAAAGSRPDLKDPATLTVTVRFEYFMIMTILSMLALCLTIAAALGIKLLVGL